MDNPEKENDIWFNFDSRWNMNQYSSTKFRRFILNKVCPNCGTKIYWLKGKDKLMCPNCGEQPLSLDEPAENAKLNNHSAN